VLNAAKSFKAAGNFGKAEELCKQVLADSRQQEVQNNLILAETNLELAEIYEQQGQTDEAEHYYKKALTHYDELTKREKRTLYELPLSYSNLLKQLKRKQESEIIAHKYLDVYAPTP
jgi:tetratricopeptide (TPR) repeat protein